MTRSRRLLFAALCAGLAIGFAALGVWQVERRGWKLALIDRVERRLAAAPVAAPAPGSNATDDEYRRVAATGRFDHCRTVLTQAVTVLGPGRWVMTPLATTAGFTVLVNRGFLPDGRTPERCGTPALPVAVTGLLRRSEPGGGFLRRNDPAAGRWYSRDVAAIGRGLPRLAPYFIDAGANGDGWPRGGLTVVRFRNSHLVYAVTWFGLALLSAAGAVIVWRRPA